MITGPTPAATTAAVRESLQRAVSCVTVAVLVPQVDTVETKLNLSSRLLRTLADGTITVSIRHAFVVMHNASGSSRARWSARTTGYMYALDAEDGREILAYHWHPAGRSPITSPHLHLGAGAEVERRELTKAHLGTGFVAPIELLALILEQFAVRPRRADWAAVLEQSRRALAIA